MTKTLNMAIAAIVLALVAVAGFMAVIPSPAAAVNIKQNLCDGAELQINDSGKTCAENNTCPAGAPTGCTNGAEHSVNKLITKIVNVFSIIVGILAVVMIIIGGAKFITSSGDAGRVTSAKNTILYAIIGLIVVALAQFIVKFVLNATPSS